MPDAPTLENASEAAPDLKEEGFHFFIPMEKSFLEKALTASVADNDPKSWKIGGYASSSDTDLEGESIDPYGIDTSYFLKFGYFNDDHQKGAAHKVGVPTEAFVDNKGLYVRGYLLKDIPEAQGIYRLMKTLASGNHNRQVGFSVEGKVIDQQGGRILKCWVKDIAITANPVNTKTYAELLKSLKEKYGAIVPEPDLVKKSEESEVPLKEIKEHTKIDRGQFEKIVRLAEEISVEAKKLIAEDVEEFGKGMEAGHDGTPSPDVKDGAALRVKDLDNKLKVTTNSPEEDEEIVKYAMEKGGFTDMALALKLIEYARLLKAQEGEIPSQEI
ncbi:Uncharacterised protein [uncultured archaeon]|nr:Uncharacterised protein [uncultured archaeon]